MTDHTARIDQLTAALYSTAAVLIESIADPEALAQATLKERAYATKVVSHMLATVRRSQPDHPLSVPSHINWDFAEDNQPGADNSLAPAVRSALSQPVVVETSSHAGGTPAAPQAAPVQSRIPPIRTAVDTLLGRGPSGRHPGIAPELPGTASARTKKKARASRRAHEQVLARARKSC